MFPLLPASGSPVFRSAQPRLLLLSQPSHAVLEGMSSTVIRLGLPQRLGRATFHISNWHQSWSGRYEDTPAMRDRLRRVGSRISTPMFTMAFNRIAGTDHWTLLGRGRPAGFRDMLAEVRTELRRSDLDAPGHSPHVTISYRAPEPLPAIPIAPIAWPVDEIRLVVGTGAPYHYEVLDAWRLAPPPPPRQLTLF